jgi:hypothetical protein
MVVLNAHHDGDRCPNEKGTSKVYGKKEEANEIRCPKIINFHNDIITSTRCTLY